MPWFDFVLIALAADAITSAWFYGSIFERWRNYFKKLQETGTTRTSWFFGTLLTCNFCLPYHIAFWTLVLLWLPGIFLGEPWHTVSRVPLYAFAATTVIHFLQQTRPFEAIPEEEIDEPDHDAA